jgi:hypothetical protein
MGFQARIIVIVETICIIVELRWKGLNADLSASTIHPHQDLNAIPLQIASAGRQEGVSGVEGRRRERRAAYTEKKEKAGTNYNNIINTPEKTGPNERHGMRAS